MKRIVMSLLLVVPFVTHCDEWWQADIPKRNLGQMQKDGEFRVLSMLIKPGDIVFDGGANVGLWSEEVLKLTKNDVALYAFEPTPESYGKCAKKLKGSGTKLFKLALADADKRQTFFCYPGGKQYFNSLFDWMNKQKVKITVQCRAIDSFCAEHKIEHIDFLKLDIEGAEFTALTGAKEMLAAQRVRFVQFEYNNHPRANLKGIYNLLTGCGYKVYKILSKELKPIPEWDGRLEDKKFTNYLAVAPAASIKSLEFTD